MAKVLRSDVKLDDEVIPAGTKMSSKVFPTKLKKQLKDYGFFVDEAEVEEEDSNADASEEEEKAEEEVQDETEGEG